ncbi:MAG: hypothetical protein QW054_03530 [Candidatus Micrarchaeia archaeon]
MRSFSETKKSFTKSEILSSLEGISFGLVDGSICALGAAVGIVTATNDPFLAVLSILIFGLSDSFGNSAGFYLSQVSERNIQIMRKRMGRTQHVHTTGELFLNGVLTFVSTFIIYILIGLPFVFLPLEQALISAVIIAALVTFLLGAYNANIIKKDVIKTGMFYSGITVATAIICYLFGLLLNNLFF